MATTTYQVDGMTSEHCVSAVTEELKKVRGVTDVAVALVGGGTSSVTVTSAVEPDPDAVAAAIEQAGYSLA